jgi:hypothetical protein
MGLRDQLTAYAAARNRRFLVAAVPALALPLAIVLARRASGDYQNRLWAILLTVVGLAFTAYILWDFQWRPRFQEHLCPQCRLALAGRAERAAIETGRCPKCKVELT